MSTRTYRANAKLNLSLDVTGKREDGYHLMDMVNTSVSLSDTLTFTETPEKEFTISSDVRFFPTGEKNLIWKAAALLAEQTGNEMPRIHVHVAKRIPTQAGLGGGSADAAAAMTALNGLCGYHLSLEKLMELSVRIGADVPFCLKGGYARVQGIGEEIVPFETSCRYHLVIAMPRTGKSTKAAFDALDRMTPESRPDTDRMVSFLKEGKLVPAFGCAGNLFQNALPDPVTETLAAEMRSNGAVHASLTGTGAAVFGVFRSYQSALRCRDLLRASHYAAWTAQPRPCGVERLDR